MVFLFIQDSTESTQVGESGGDGIRKDLGLGLFQGSPEAQPHYMHEAVGSNILGSPSVEITFRVPCGKKRHSPGGFLLEMPPLTLVPWNCPNLPCPASLVAGSILELLNTFSLHKCTHLL